MRYLLALTLLFLAFSPSTSIAANVLPEPACFTVYNDAPYKVLGTIATDYFTRDDGIKTRHRSNFRLEPGERNEFCTTGPFYPDWTLELILRSLFPVFNCRTRIDQGEIVIHGRVKPEGGTETWADCFR
jgi:hypothetical protein